MTPDLNLFHFPNLSTVSMEHQREFQPETYQILYSRSFKGKSGTSLHFITNPFRHRQDRPTTPASPLQTARLAQ
jgi:hypothetical protein